MCLEGNVEKRYYLHTATNATTTSTTTIATVQVKGIRVKLSRNIQADGEVNQNVL